MSGQLKKGELEASQQTVKFFETMLRASADGIVITDAAQNITVVNEAFCNLLGRHRREVIETNLLIWLEQFHTDAPHRWVKLQKRVYLKGSCSNVEFQMATKDEARYFSVNASVLERVADEERGVIFSIWRDITAQKQAEDELAKHRDHLEELVKDRTVKLEKGNVLLKQEVTERKKTEETLKESEERYHTLFNSGNDAVFVHHPTKEGLPGKFIEVNDAATKMLGYSREELLKLSPTEIAVWEQAGPTPQEVMKQLLTQKRVLTKSAFTSKDGRKIPVEVNIHLFELRGQPTILTIARDITESIKAEVALRNSEASLTKAQRIAHLGNWDWDIVNNNLLWSDEIYRIFGIKPQQFKANYEAFLKTVHPADRELVQQSVDKALKNGKMYNIDHRIVLPNGSERIVNEQAEVSFGAKGDPIRMVGTIQDITERKKAEHDLGERFKELMCLYGISQYIIEPSIDVDKLLLETANLIPPGWQYPDITCTRITFDDKEFKTDNFKETKWKQTSDILVKGEKHGSVAVYYLEEKPQFDEGPFLKEERDLIDGVSRMLSEALGRKKAEKDKEELQAQLQQSQKMEAVGRLAGGIAHDFNNLLTVIIGYSQMLLSEKEEGDAEYADIKEIQKAGKSAASLTGQLLLFSRKQPIYLTVININEAVMDMGKMLKRVIGENIELKTELGKDLENVKADPGQIEQVVMNLAINARDAMPSGGKLSITTQMADIDKLYAELNPEAKSGRYNCITIEDNGRGMDKDTLQHIFEPFFTTKEAGKGTGLGLSVVFGIIKQHGGWINVYSEVGKGTAFKIYLPSVPEGVDKEKDEEVKLSELKGNGETILVVEDEDGVREFTRKVLEQNGYTVIAATTAKESLEVFEREKDNIDLVFSDVVLPDMNGIKLVQDLSSRSPRLKYILCSGYTQNNHNVIMELQEESRYIHKPYSIVDLLKIVKRALA